MKKNIEIVRFECGVVCVNCAWNENVVHVNKIDQLVNLARASHHCVIFHICF